MDKDILDESVSEYVAILVPIIGREKHIVELDLRYIYRNSVLYHNRKKAQCVYVCHSDGSTIRGGSWYHLYTYFGDIDSKTQYKYLSTEQFLNAVRRNPRKSNYGYFHLAASDYKNPHYPITDITSTNSKIFQSQKSSFTISTLGDNYDEYAPKRQLNNT